MRRLISCVLAAAMMCGLVACSGKDAGQAASQEGKSQTADSEEAELKKNYTVSYDGVETGDVSSGAAVHDPSILAAEGAYYIYGSHMTAAKSTDLLSWTKLADGYSPSNPVYGQIYDDGVKEKAFAYAGMASSRIKTDDGSTHVWAPDVIYNKAAGKYYMYYCTTSTWKASNLCYGISDSPEGPFAWQGALIYSGYSLSELEATDVLDYVDEDYVRDHYIKAGAYNYEDYPNAIDPAVFYDEDDRLWMVYGSWSGGIFLLELDPQTGLVIHPEADPDRQVDPYYGKRLLGGGHISIEAPYILYDEGSGYYYLFVSYGSLTSNGGYQIRVFRSETADGTYVDMNGAYPAKSAMHADYGLKLSGNYKLPSLERAYMATGHNSAFVDSDGKRYLVYHTRFNDGGERHSPRVHQMFLNQNGWPVELPYQTRQETISESGYDTDTVTGRYYVVNQGTDISSDIANPIIVYLNADGTCEGREVSGTWGMESGTYYMSITLDGETFDGVFCRMQDEAGKPVMSFSAVGQNESLWGVKYLEDEA